MGDYTGVAFEATIKEEAVPTLNLLMERVEWPETPFVMNNPELRGWLNIRRRGFIPFGAVCYVEDFAPHTSEWNPETRIWKVSCSLKNYKGEIQYFLDKVLPHLIEGSCLVRTRFEYDEEPTMHLINAVEGAA